MKTLYPVIQLIPPGTSDSIFSREHKVLNWQIPFQAITASGEAITTEAGINITTEAGDNLVTE